jgi:transcriptional regulator with XRE-family HTH domain
MTLSRQPLGPLLRQWRQQRRLSQLHLASAAAISSRHLSFIETGRAKPSRQMVLHLCEQLELPLRERNHLLTAAGFAPVFGERALDHPQLQAARQAVAQVLAGHEPYPALAIDRHWQLLDANRAVAALLEGVADHLLQPPLNVLRLSLHPQGLAPRIVNLWEWRMHLLERLTRQIELTADPILVALRMELASYPAAAPPEPKTVHCDAPVVIPLTLRSRAGTLSMFSTTMVFGTAADVTLAELAIESFFPADPATAAALRTLTDVSAMTA